MWCRREQEISAWPQIASGEIIIDRLQTKGSLCVYIFRLVGAPKKTTIFIKLIIVYIIIVYTIFNSPEIRKCTISARYHVRYFDVCPKSTYIQNEAIVNLQVSILHRFITNYIGLRSLQCTVICITQVAFNSINSQPKYGEEISANERPSTGLKMQQTKQKSTVFKRLRTFVREIFLVIYQSCWCVCE